MSKKPISPAFDRIPPDAKKEFDEALKFIASCPYRGTAIKIELEAQLNRPCSDDEEYCDNCGGDGCYYGDDDEEIPCSDCNGTGYYSQGAEWDDDACRQFILDHIPAKVSKAIIYGRFYYDGSVDSEFTFTLPLNKAAYALYVVEAFEALAKAIGGGLQTSGAGMHMAILNNPEGRYGNYNLNTLDSTCVHNFSKAMMPLLPALYFLASPDHNARGLSYRGPSFGVSTKGSAIAANNNVFEYRIFETCYQRPLAIIDNVIVIAKTLQFYKQEATDTSAGIGPIGFRDGSDGLDRFYFSTNHIKALKHGLKFLKPDYKDISRLEKERAFKVDEKAIHEAHLKRLAQWKAEFSDVKQRRKYERQRIYYGAMRDAYQHLQAGGRNIADPKKYAKEQLAKNLPSLRGNVRQYVKEKNQQYSSQNCRYTVTV